MGQLHPVFAQILGSLQAIPAQVAAAQRPTLAQYEAALRRMDWQFEFSDDGEVYRRGRAELQCLRTMQAELDPTGAVWRSIAPHTHAVPIAPHPQAEQLRQAHQQEQAARFSAEREFLVQVHRQDGTTVAYRRRGGCSAQHVSEAIDLGGLGARISVQPAPEQEAA